MCEAHLLKTTSPLLTFIKRKEEESKRKAFLGSKRSKKYWKDKEVKGVELGGRRKKRRHCFSDPREVRKREKEGEKKEEEG